MSGICGVVTKHGDPARLKPVLDRIAYRGVDAVTQWAGNGVGLGHALLATTPEAEIERLPLKHDPSGCVITADARLDNRDELAALLGIDLQHRSTGDAELILLTYLAEGIECPKRLLGDFSFAIWDPRQDVLFCARDHMGVRPFYYAAPRGDLVFASDFDAVRSHPSVSNAVNAARIADFLRDNEGEDFDSTFGSEIRRLPPAHHLRWHLGEIKTARYWKLTPRADENLNEDRDYVRSFLKIFEEAIRCRLRSNGPVAAMLSGGVDSGSIASTAALMLNDAGKPRLQTVSAVSDQQGCEETNRIITQAKNPLFDPRFVPAQRLGAYLKSLRAAYHQPADPFDHSMSILRAVFLLAEKGGARVVLDGGAGDLLFANGNHAAELLRQGKTIEAWRALRSRRKFALATTFLLSDFLKSAWAGLAPQFLRRAWQSRKSNLQRFQHKLKKASFRSVSTRPAIGIETEQKAVLRPFGTKYRTSLLESPSLAAGNERYDRAAAFAHVEPRDPFLDVRLVEFCLALPAAMLERDGWPKFILRKAMRGRVPDEVLWKPGKYHLGPIFTRSVIEDWSAYTEETDRLGATLGPYLDSNALGNSAKTNLPSLVALSFWLKRAY